MLIGVAVTFAVVATLAAVAGGWAVEANQYGRAAATPLRRFLDSRSCFRRSPIGSPSLLWFLGCACPKRLRRNRLPVGALRGLVLGLILTGTALEGASVPPSEPGRPGASPHRSARMGIV
jgi:hypothetical protein